MVTFRYFSLIFEIFSDFFRFLGLLGKNDPTDPILTEIQKQNCFCFSYIIAILKKLSSVVHLKKAIFGPV
jgi:hypothetical protein